VTQFTSSLIALPWCTSNRHRIAIITLWVGPAHVCNTYLVRTRTHAQAQAPAHSHRHTHAHAHARTHPHTHTHTYSPTHTHTQWHKRARTHRHKRPRTRTHTQAQARADTRMQRTQAQARAQTHWTHVCLKGIRIIQPIIIIKFMSSISSGSSDSSSFLFLVKCCLFHLVVKSLYNKFSITADL
jgi:hypothetical protein